MTTILVTGCAGFIGSHVCEFLLKNGYKVIGVDNFDTFYSKEIKEKNLSQFLLHPEFKFYEADITAGLDIIKEQTIDAVVHLAAKAGVRPSIQNPEKYIFTNINGTQKVHEFMLARSIRKLIFASSSSIYGNNKKVPFNEADNVDNPISPYAFTKRTGELMNYTHHFLNNIDVINLRFFTVYGPRQRPDLAINKFVKQVLNNEAVVLFGNGDTARDYTYIDDIVEGIYKAIRYCIENENIYQVVNLGNNSPVKLIDLVDTIFTIIGREKALIFEPMQPGDVDITFADITKARLLFNYQPSTDIKTGIKKYIEWYQHEDLKF